MGSMKRLKRTTVYFDPDVRRAVSRRASQSHQSVSQVVNEAIRGALADNSEHLKAAQERARRKPFEFADGMGSFESDRSTVENILWLLYVSRRLNGGGLGGIQIEQELGCPATYLEFHFWYLREKGWIQRLDNGLLAITIAGVDKVIEQDNIILPHDHLIPESTGPSSGPNGSNGHSKLKGLLQH